MVGKEFSASGSSKFWKQHFGVEIIKFAPGAVEFYFIYFKAILGILKLRKRQITSMTNQSDLAGATVCTALNARSPQDPVGFCPLPQQDGGSPIQAESRIGGR